MELAGRIQELYQIERVAKERAEKKGKETALFQERKNVRRQSQKFVREFFEQCRVLKESERPTSLVAQAVSYALNIEEELKKFLKDSRLNIDNNPAERLNRGIAIIRKNCLFAGNEAGGQRLAILLCKSQGAEPSILRFLFIFFVRPSFLPYETKKTPSAISCSFISKLVTVLLSQSKNRTLLLATDRFA